MTSKTAQISSPRILVNPSPNLRKYLSSIILCEAVPPSISLFISKSTGKIEQKDKSIGEASYLVSNDKKKTIKSLDVTSEEDFLPRLSLSDLHWLYEHIQENRSSDKKWYLHELLDGSDIILPKNEEIPRNEELELRCRKLKALQENRDYIKMTKCIDSVKKYYPEDSFNYQLKQMNRSLLAIFQFLITVAAGFAFGFIGIELIIGNLDFGFRLLLGIICALIIALAELYFLAKTLNEEVLFENNINNKIDKNFKLD